MIRTQIKNARVGPFEFAKLWNKMEKRLKGFFGIDLSTCSLFTRYYFVIEMNNNQMSLSGDQSHSDTVEILAEIFYR